MNYFTLIFGMASMHTILTNANVINGLRNSRKAYSVNEKYSNYLAHDRLKSVHHKKVEHNSPFLNQFEMFHHEILKLGSPIFAKESEKIINSHVKPVVFSKFHIKY